MSSFSGQASRAIMTATACHPTKRPMKLRNSPIPQETLGLSKLRDFSDDLKRSSMSNKWGHWLGVTTLNIMTSSITTLSIMTLGIATLSIMTLSITTNKT